MASNNKPTDSKSESISAHSRTSSSTAHSADVMGGLLHPYTPSISAPHIGNALVRSGISIAAPIAIDGLALLPSAIDSVNANMPVDPIDFDQARLGLRILASLRADHYENEQSVNFAECQDLAKLALTIIDAADLAVKNRAKSRPVAFRTYDLVRMLFDVSKAGVDINSHLEFSELKRDFSKIFEIVTAVGKENTVQHLIHPEAASVQLAECDIILNGYVDKIKTSLLKHKQQMLVRQDAQLADLAVSKGHISNISKVMVFHLDRVLLFPSKDSGHLPLPPSHFVGRDDLVHHGVEHILQTPSARVIILGLGGMGKTSLALATVHADSVRTAFGDKRFFVSCEGLKSGLDLALAIISTLGGSFMVVDEQDILAKLSQQLIYAGNILLVIDNFETLWLGSSSLTEVQRVLELVFSAQSLALILTMRGDIPPHNTSWSLILPPEGLGPLALNAAKDMFLKNGLPSNLAPSISESEHDLDQLLVETNCIPLVISLLSVLRGQFTCAELYAKWCAIKTELLQISTTEQTKLTSIAVSIELSLRVPAITDCVDATRLLAIIAFLPEGIPHWDIILEDLVPGIADPYVAVDVLCRAALVYKSSHNSVTMLSPTRYYIQAQKQFNSIWLEKDLEIIYKFMHDCMQSQSNHIALLGKANISEILIRLVSIRPTLELAQSVLKLSEYLESELQMNLSSMVEQIIPIIKNIDAPKSLLAGYLLHYNNLLMGMNLWAMAEEQCRMAYELYSQSKNQLEIAKSLQAQGHALKMQSNTV
ncbi:hypothetical protein JR316_0008798 [Psilocybe cubensis]|uniref:Uncharacterized protein n=1 Tax=Psilocybe cubensis TaxID=181762 RepID=A0ACB8GRX4_PSICU|nr:hypothetical protein JR316_0008798 [Psilocybe cubensis]KAH9478344.1 hypothetical protein JR316_0008798 [Psilocybe cubensis]